MHARLCLGFKRLGFSGFKCLCSGSGGRVSQVQMAVFRFKWVGAYLLVVPQLRGLRVERASVVRLCGGEKRGEKCQMGELKNTGCQPKVWRWWMALV